jgi:hypothetical protein
MAGRGFVVALLLAVGAAAIVVWQLSSAHDTACFLKSVRVGSVTQLQKEHQKKKKYLTEHCKSKPFKTVVRYLNVEEPDELQAKSALVLWIALLAVTVGFVPFVGVRSAIIIREVDPPRDARFIGRSVGAFALVAVPFLVFQGLPKVAHVELSRFDHFESTQLTWIPLLVGVFVAPAVIGLEAIGRVLSTRALGLPDTARLGSRLRELVGMLGAILSFAVLDTAARSQTIDKLPGGEALPSTIVLLWGSAFVLVLAVLYVPVHQRWAAETARLISEEVARQLSGTSLPGTPGFRPAELSLTKELNETLGVGGPLKSLRGSVAVLSPVIAAAVTSLFS